MRRNRWSRSVWAKLSSPFLAVTWISERVGYQAGPVNVGFVRLRGDEVLLIDADLPQQPIMADVDATMLNQALTNLIKLRLNMRV